MSAPAPRHDDNVAPVTEEVTVVDLAVTGTLPPALAGRYVRTGPNPLATGGEHAHYFTGAGMVHGVELHGGAARSYRNRWVRSPEISAHFGEAPPPRDEGGWYAGSGNTNVVHHAGRIWAITEGSLPYELSVDLDTVRAHAFGGPLPGGFNAHPKFDPGTGELHVVSYGFEPPFLRYHVVDAAGRLRRTEDIAMGGPVMVHDMGLTATQVVIFDLPVVFNLEMAMAGVQIPFRWEPDYRARVGLMPRAGTGADTVWADVEPCFVYHPLNAYDEGGSVVLDVAVFPRAFDDGATPAQGVPTLQRWTIDPVGRKAVTDTVDSRPQEFPRADERLAGVKHRYGYLLAGGDRVDAEEGTSPRFRSVLKHDLVAGTTEVQPLGPGRIGSEFVFVPASEDAGEDEGWLLGYVYDAARDASDLVVLDAHDFGGGPVASVHLPVRGPQGFHGNWIPDRALSDRPPAG